MSENLDQATGSTDQPWYAVRTFNCQEQKVSRFLAEQGTPHFIPMTFAGTYTDEENPKRILVPAIHNLFSFRRQVASGTC